MDQKIKYTKNGMLDQKRSFDFLCDKEIEKARNFHENFPQYTKTPLVKLDNLAKNLNLDG